MTDTGECALHRAWNPRGKKVNSGAGRNRDDEEFARRIPSPLLRLLSLFSSFLSLFPFPFVACQRTNKRIEENRMDGDIFDSQSSLEEGDGMARKITFHEGK